MLVTIIFLNQLKQKAIDDYRATVETSNAIPCGNNRGTITLAINHKKTAQSGWAVCNEKPRVRIKESVYDKYFLAVLIISFVSKNCATSTTASLSRRGASLNLCG